MKFNEAFLQDDQEYCECWEPVVWKVTETGKVERKEFVCPRCKAVKYKISTDTVEAGDTLIGVDLGDFFGR